MSDARKLTSWNEELKKIYGPPVFKPIAPEVWRAWFIKHGWPMPDSLKTDKEKMTP